MRPLVWFRSDLRVHDNRALAQACRDAAGPVLGVFTICPKQWEAHDWSSAKVSLVMRTLAELSGALTALNIPLLIVEEPTFAGVPGRLLALAERHQCDGLYFSREYEWNERTRDEQVSQAFERTGRVVRTFSDRVLFEPGILRTQSGGMYTVYSPFRRACIARLLEGGLPEVEPAPRARAGSVCKPDRVPEAVAGFGGPTHADLWAAGESEAKKRLDRFARARMADYREARDLLAEPGTSELSPYLAIGAISIRACLARAARAAEGTIDGGPAGPCTWINELLWREFYTHVMWGFPRVSKGRAFRPETESIRWEEDERLFRAWCEGKTGYPIVDAGMHQMAQTGWMHNRARMIVASFLTKDLGIDWRSGERFFMRHLVDGDLANNNGGWQWSASTGTDAQPYFRIFNPVSQSRRYDPKGAYIRRYVPELERLDEKQIHEGGGLFRPGRYPAPIVDHATAREAALRRFGGNSEASR